MAVSHRFQYGGKIAGRGLCTIVNSFIWRWHSIFYVKVSSMSIVLVFQKSASPAACLSVCRSIRPPFCPLLSYLPNISTLKVYQTVTSFRSIGQSVGRSIRMYVLQFYKQTHQIYHFLRCWRVQGIRYIKGIYLLIYLFSFCIIVFRI